MSFYTTAPIEILDIIADYRSSAEHWTDVVEPEVAFAVQEIWFTNTCVNVMQRESTTDLIPILVEVAMDNLVINLTAWKHEGYGDLEDVCRAKAVEDVHGSLVDQMMFDVKRAFRARPISREVEFAFRACMVSPAFEQGAVMDDIRKRLYRFAKMTSYHDLQYEFNEDVLAEYMEELRAMLNTRLLREYSKWTMCQLLNHLLITEP